MRKGKLFSLLRHAFQMVGRTWKSYALLSVTIVLSFSLLLGYLTFPTLPSITIPRNCSATAGRIYAYKSEPKMQMHFRYW